MGRHEYMGRGIARRRVRGSTECKPSLSSLVVVRWPLMAGAPSPQETPNAPNVSSSHSQPPRTRESIDRPSAARFVCLPSVGRRRLRVYCRRLALNGRTAAITPPGRASEEGPSFIASHRGAVLAGRARSAGLVAFIQCGNRLRAARWLWLADHRGGRSRQSCGRAASGRLQRFCAPALDDR